jgi:hypothetical protein
MLYTITLQSKLFNFQKEKDVMKERKVWHIQINGISWCQFDVVKELEKAYFEMNEKSRALRKFKPEKQWSMCCSTTDRNERERFANALRKHVMGKVEVIEGECQQWQEPYDGHYED